MQSSYTVKHVVRDAAEHMAMVGSFRVAIYTVWLTLTTHSFVQACIPQLAQSSYTVEHSKI